MGGSGVVRNLPRTNGIPQSTRVAGYAILLLGYFLVLFMIIFANVAVIACVKLRLDGGNPAIIDGLRVSLAQLRRIAAWVFLTGSIGLLLKLVGRLDTLGSTAERVLGFTWEIATWFVVPVMIFEGRGLIEGLQRSSSLVRKTWGESLTVGVGLTAFVLYLALPALALPLVCWAALGSPAVRVGLTIDAAYWLSLGVLSSGLSSVLRAALYAYAAEGRLPPTMDNRLVQAAFVAR